MTARILVISHNEAAITRLPRRIGTGRDSFPLNLGAVDQIDAEGVLAAILIDLDERTARTAVLSGRPLLVDLPTLRRLLVSDASDLLRSAQWVPLLPLRRAVDVLEARRIVAQGTIGRILGGEVVTLIGEPSHPNWDLDHLPAGTTFEALAYGLDVLATFDCQVVESRWSSTDDSIRRLEHRTTDRAMFVQWLMPAKASAAPQFRASLIGKKGTVWLRAPFAPGAVTLWENDEERYRSPRLHRDTPNIQAPDTARGGLEVQRILMELLGEDRRPVADLCEAGFRAVHAANAALSTIETRTGRPQT